MTTRHSLAAPFVIIALFLTLGFLMQRDQKMDYGSTQQVVGPHQEKEKAGSQAAAGERHVTPDNHTLTPAGIQVELGDLRPNAVALSPDGRLLIAAGSAGVLVCVDPGNGKILQEVKLPAEDQLAAPVASENILKPDRNAKLSFTGLCFSPNGRQIFLSNVNGSIKVFQVAENGQVTPSFTIPLPPADAPKRKTEIPAGLAVSPDGKLLYVALNLSNRVAEIEIDSSRVLRLWPVGVAPFDVALAQGKLYVSNWGGRVTTDGIPSGPAGRGTFVRVDETTSAAKEGSVSIISLGNEQPIKEIPTGRHASALAVQPGGNYVVCACAADDFLAVLETRTDTVVEKIWPKRTPADLFGATPAALAFSADGKTLYVANATQNAVAVVEFSPGKSELEGLIPTAWFPGGLAFDTGRNRVHVANIKGLGSWARIPEDKPKQYISGHQYGTLSLIDLPKGKAALDAQTLQVLSNARGAALQTALLPPRPKMPAKPVPERHGEPSVFKHVLYIIKENRTYDQVLGDMPQGNGEPKLCIFGEKVTPNQHQLCRDFVLLDNTYCSGVLSADGHNWSCSAITTDYVERSFSGWPRSYPDGSSHADADALAWAPTGFIWDAALRRGLQVRNYGEFCNSDLSWKDEARKSKPHWKDIWQDFQGGTNAIHVGCTPTIDSLNAISCREFPAWEKSITDVQRAAVFLKELKGWEESGAMPNLMIMSLSMDHTSATLANFPTPAAQVADNDLAFGQMVDAISHSRFWKDTCIFAIEDDPQNGWDHVSAYRTTAYVASPYTKRGEVIHTQYNQTSILRTIELMLGLPPMHELDAIATPLFDCFTATPNFAPWKCLPNTQPLDQMNPSPVTMQDGPLKKDAEMSAKLPLDRMDACPEDILNEILWRSVMGEAAPYPSWAAGQSEEDEAEEK